MKKFIVKDGVHIKTKKNKSELNYTYLLALVILSVFSIMKVGVIPIIMDNSDINNLIYSLIFVTTSIIVSILVDQVSKLLFNKKEFNCYYKSVSRGLLISLLIPFETSIIILSFGVLIASLIANIPANIKRKIPINGIVIGWGLITIFNYIDSHLLNNSLKLISEGSFNFNEIMGENNNFIDILLGFSNDLGSSSIVLLIPVYIMLTYTNTIKYRIPVIIIATTFMMSAIISGINGTELWYPLINVLAGNLIVATIFIATDNETTPVTPIGQILFALLIGIITIIIRYLTPIVDGIIIALFIVPFFKNKLDKIGAISRFNFNKSILIYLILWILIILISIFIGITI